MSTPGRVDDALAEKFLGGGTVDGEPDPLAAVVRTLRTAGTQPVPPTSALAAHMASGAFPGPGERYEATRYHSPAHRPQGRGFGAAARSARNLVRAFAAAPRKLPGRGLAFRASVLAVALALVGTGGAGFAQVLPEPAQVRFEQVVESVTPYEFRGRSEGPGERVDPTPSRRPGGTGPGQDSGVRPSGPPTHPGKGATGPPDGVPGPPDRRGPPDNAPGPDGDGPPGPDGDGPPGPDGDGPPGPDGDGPPGQGGG